MKFMHVIVENMVDAGIGKLVLYQPRVHGISIRVNSDGIKRRLNLFGWKTI